MGYVTKRLLSVFPVMFCACTLVFFFIHMIPGDPVEIMLGEMATQADKQQLRSDLNLDKPVWEQYFDFMNGLVTKGSLGESFYYKESVTTIISKRYGWTLLLAFSAMIVAVIIAIPIGVISALRRGSALDAGAGAFALLGLSMPNFWLGPLLILFVSIKLGLLPVSGEGGLTHLILPAFTLGFGMSGILSRITRASMLEVLDSPYVTSAKAKGLSKAKVVAKHALKNALIPVITIMGMQFGALLAGSIITETIFSWEGVGQLLIRAISARDYPLLQGCVLVMALSYVLVNLTIDLAYGFVDPRVRERMRRPE